LVLFTQTNNLYHNIHLLFFGQHKFLINFLLLPKNPLPFGFAIKTFRVFSTAIYIFGTVTIFWIGYTVETTKKTIFTKLIGYRTVSKNRPILNKSILDTLLRISRYIATEV